MKNTRENDKKWIQTLQERNRVLEEVLALTQLENKELKEQLATLTINESYNCDCEGLKEDVERFKAINNIAYRNTQ